MRWAEDLDFLGTPKGAKPWAWGVLLLGVLAVLGVAQHYAQAKDQQEHADWQLQLAQRKLAAKQTQVQHLSANSTGYSSTSASAEHERLALRQAKDVADALTHPWGWVLASMEDACNPDGGQALLGVRHSATTPEVLIDAAVRDDAAALKLVDALAAKTETFAEARLQSRDTLTQGVGDLRLHVQIAAVLRADLASRVVTPTDAEPRAGQNAEPPLSERQVSER